jgi:hypothetical protein
VEKELGLEAKLNFKKKLKTAGQSQLRDAQLLPNLE